MKALPPADALGTAIARRRLLCLLRLLVTLPAGLLWRFAPLHLPPFAYKYGGSALWAAAVYWVFAGLLPARQPWLVARLAATAAVAVECFKLVQQPALNHFRSTLAGKVLLGRYFTLGAILAYLLTITGVALLDRRWLHRPMRSCSTH